MAGATTTSGVLLKINFSSAPSSSRKVWMGSPQTSTAGCSSTAQPELASAQVTLAARLGMDKAPGKVPGERAKAEALFAEFAPTLAFFEANIGPYPFGDEKLGDE